MASILDLVESPVYVLDSIHIAARSQPGELPLENSLALREQFLTLDVAVAPIYYRAHQGFGLYTSVDTRFNIKTGKIPSGRILPSGRSISIRPKSVGRLLNPWEQRIFSWLRYRQAHRTYPPVLGPQNT